MLRGVRLSIAPGERVAVLGQSGTGKSTLLDALYDVSAAQAALIPQAAGLVPQLSVFHNVYMGRLDRPDLLRHLRELAWPARSTRIAIEKLLVSLGLAGVQRQSAGSLSGGQAQRVSVARALHAERPVVIGDEPVSALDPAMAAAVLERVLAAHRTSIVALHDVGLALRCCTRILALRDGRIALDAPAASLQAADLTPFYDAAR